MKDDDFAFICKFITKTNVNAESVKLIYSTKLLFLKGVTTSSTFGKVWILQ